MKIFPSSQASPNSSEKDRRFLKEIQKTREECDASFVNFSAYNYKPEGTESLHFVTYPLDWITHYIQSQFVEIDPLFRTDFRRTLYVDWSEIHQSADADRLFLDFQERGLGDNGISLTCHIEADTYAVTSFVFKIDDQRWQTFRNTKMELFRFLSERLARQHDSIYNDNQASEYKITRREKQCLFWVAMGKTDEEIGNILHIGKWTVVGHLKSAKHKLGASNRASAVATAMSSGIIDIKKPAP
ncbi:MAG: helix-turn-helix transcriptional regulator [Rhizobiaceae bacterium]